MCAQEPTSDRLHEAERSSELWLDLRGRAMTCCGSNCSTFNHLHQAAGYIKELEVKAGDSDWAVMLKTRLDLFYHKWQTHPNISKNIFKNSLALDANEEKVRQRKYTEFCSFIHNTHKALMSSLQWGLAVLDRGCCDCSLHCGQSFSGFFCPPCKQGKWVSRWEAGKRGQRCILSPATLDIR